MPLSVACLTTYLNTKIIYLAAFLLYLDIISIASYTCLRLINLNSGTNFLTVERINLRLPYINIFGFLGVLIYVNGCLLSTPIIYYYSFSFIYYDILFNLTFT